MKTHSKEILTDRFQDYYQSQGKAKTELKPRQMILFR